MRASTDVENKPKTKSNFKTVGLLGAGHVINDSYMNFFQPLLPLIVQSLNLSIANVGLMTTFFSITSSLSQLAIGRITDRFGARYFIFLGPLLAAVAMSSIGLTRSYPLLVVLVSLAGLGIAAFHPPASAMVGSMEIRKRGWAMSLFSLGGNIGFAIMPLLVVPLAYEFGLASTVMLALPGLVMAALLFKYSPGIARSELASSIPFAVTARANLRPFACLLGTVTFRSISFFGLTTFLPILLHQRGFSPVISGTVLSVLAFSGAFGGLIGGFISDRIGRKPVIVTSLALAVPFINLALGSSGTMLIVWLGLSGAALLASFSVAVVAAQEIFPDNKATASSLALGFGLGLGGIGVGVIGFIADTIGLDKALPAVSFLPFVAATFALGLPRKRSEHEAESELLSVVDYVDSNR